jgi:hypothetical protein
MHFGLCINFSYYQGNIKTVHKVGDVSDPQKIKDPVLCVFCSEDTTAHRPED